MLVSKNTPYYTFSGPMYEALKKAWARVGASPKLIPKLALYGTYQTAYESGYGTSDLAKKHNYGGMKNGNKGWQSFNSKDDFARAYVDNILEKYPLAMNASTFDQYMNYLFDGPYQYDPVKGKNAYSNEVKGAMGRVNANIAPYWNELYT